MKYRYIEKFMIRQIQNTLTAQISAPALSESFVTSMQSNHASSAIISHALMAGFWFTANQFASMHNNSAGRDWYTT